MGVEKKYIPQLPPEAHSAEYGKLKLVGLNIQNLEWDPTFTHAGIVVRASQGRAPMAWLIPPETTGIFIHNKLTHETTDMYLAPSSEVDQIRLMGFSEAQLTGFAKMGLVPEAFELIVSLTKAGVFRVHYESSPDETRARVAKDKKANSQENLPQSFQHHFSINGRPKAIMFDSSHNFQQAHWICALAHTPQEAVEAVGQYPLKTPFLN